MKRANVFMIVLAAAITSAMWFGGAAASADQPEPQLVLGFDPEVRAGDTVAVAAYLVDPSGNPISGREVTFAIASSFLNIDGQMAIGAELTDDDGLALLAYIPRIEGGREVTARFAGDDVFASARVSETLSVTPGPQLYEEFEPLRIPGANIWLTSGALAFVWGIFLFVCGMILRIAWLARAGSGDLNRTGTGVGDG